jgi:hypothetical protein
MHMIVCERGAVEAIATHRITMSLLPELIYYGLRNAGFRKGASVRDTLAAMLTPQLKPREVRIS